MRKVLFYLIFSISNFTNAQNEDGYKLVFAQVLFRHGARAPSAHLTDPAYEKAFPRGLGEMTDRGFENSYKLGQFLRERYVSTRFLDANLKPKEMYWRSVNKNRCLSSASAVGFGMFDDGQVPPRHLYVPVYTEETEENLLNYDQTTCQRELQLVRETCPDFDGNYYPWPKYEAFIANCLNYTHPVFLDYPFGTIEAHMNEYKNGMPLPAGIQKHIDQIMAIYVNVTQFITGTGNHHDPRMMRVKFGNLMRTLQKNLRRLPRERFYAYSTQDWILMGVLDSLGVLKDSVGLEVYPDYNSMILIEVYEKDGGERFVKTLYKKEEITSPNHQLIDVSNLVRNCPRDQMYCPLKTFLKCCKEYEIDEGEGCKLEDRKKSRRSIRLEKEKSPEKKKKPRFAGPE